MGPRGSLGQAVVSSGTSVGQAVVSSGILNWVHFDSSHTRPKGSLGQAVVSSS